MKYQLRFNEVDPWSFSPWKHCMEWPIKAATWLQITHVTFHSRLVLRTCLFFLSFYFTPWVAYLFSLSFFFFFFFLVSLGLHPQYMKVPRLGVESELQLPAYCTATATPDPSHICDPHLSSQQQQILNPLNKARGWTRILMDTSRVLNPLNHSGYSHMTLLISSFIQVFYCTLISSALENNFLGSSKVNFVPAV